MRRCASGLIQLLVLTAHVCASPLAIPAVEAPTPWTKATYERVSALLETLPFSPEEKVRVRISPVTSVRPAVAVVDLSPPRPFQSKLVEHFDMCPTLSGFDPLLSGRSPPLRL